MKMRSRSALGAAALAFAAGTAIAHPLRLDYCVDALPGGQYQYTFTLTLDNNDNTWAPGQGWTWITFGATQAMSSPLEDFVMDPSSYPIGPYTELTVSGGYLNGPTLGPLTDPNSNFIYWTPSAVGESLTWTGTSASFVPEAQMAFSTLITTGGAVQAAFSPAVRIVCTGAQGACCLADGTCVQLSGAGCVNAGGVYSGDNVPCSSVSCPQPATGACCRDDGCVITTQAICTATIGTYQGDNTPCATANCSPATAFREGADVGDVPGTAAVVSGSGSLSVIHGGFHHFADADMYTIQICDPATFSADLSFQGIGEIFLFDANGMGVANRLSFNGPAMLTNQFVTTPGQYHLAVAPFLKQPLDGLGQKLWNDNFDNIERAPDGPGALNPIASWDAGGGNDGPYTIALTGACFVGGTTACYPNCDNSTTAPILNVADFTCFLQRFAAGESYANCDQSTTAPTLNVADFTCFLQSFAAGCP